MKKAIIRILSIKSIIKVLIGISILFLVGCQKNELDYSNNYRGCIYLAKVDGVYHIVAEVYYSEGLDINLVNFPRVSENEVVVKSVMTSEMADECTDIRFPNSYKRIEAVSIEDYSPEEIVKSIEAYGLLMKITDYHNDVESVINPELELLGFLLK